MEWIFWNSKVASRNRAFFIVIPSMIPRTSPDMGLCDDLGPCSDMWITMSIYGLEASYLLFKFSNAAIFMKWRTLIGVREKNWEIFSRLPIRTERVGIIHTRSIFSTVAPLDIAIRSTNKSTIPIQGWLWKRSLANNKWIIKEHDRHNFSFIAKSKSDVKV